MAKSGTIPFYTVYVERNGSTIQVFNPVTRSYKMSSIVAKETIASLEKSNLYSRVFAIQTKPRK